RGGKSFALALIAVFLACFGDWQQYLGPGERGTIMIVAADRQQARVIMRYVRGLITSVPMLAPLVQRDRDGLSALSLDLRQPRYPRGPPRLVPDDARLYHCRRLA